MHGHLNDNFISVKINYMFRLSIVIIRLNLEP